MNKSKLIENIAGIGGFLIISLFLQLVIGVWFGFSETNVKVFLSTAIIIAMITAVIMASGNDEKAKHE